MNTWHQLAPAPDLADGYAAWSCDACGEQIRISSGEFLPPSCPGCAPGQDGAPLTRSEIRRIRAILAREDAIADRDLLLRYAHTMAHSIAWSGGYLRRALELAQRAVSGHQLSEDEAVEASLLLQEIRLAMVDHPR